MENLNYEKILESSPDAVIIADGNGVIVKVNIRTEHIFGYKRDDLIGNNVALLVPDGLKDCHDLQPQHLTSEGHTSLKESNAKLNGRKSDGTLFPVEISLSPLNKEGLIYAAIRDVSERHLLIDYLINQNKTLEDFAYIMSHDLRGPVGNLLSLLDIYKGEDTPEGKETMIEMFETTAVNLKETLDNLLDILLIKNDTKKERQTVSFEKVFSKIRNTFAIQIVLTKARITADFLKASEIEYPPIYLESIMQNLFSNALKYSSHERTPTVHFETNKIGGRTILTVSDNGLGIDLVANGARLFGLHNTFHDHPEAKGVGLFITKAQVESMGGQITATSEVERGTTFTVIFNK